jgi:4-coumarate--CoA ligase
MEEPFENKFMITSPIFWYTGNLLMMLGIHFGKPRLFFSTKPTTEQILGSIEKFKVSSKYYYFFLLYYKY